MGRITEAEITLNDMSLHVLPTAATAPVDDDGSGYGQNDAGGNTITQLAPLVELGDLTDSWNKEDIHDHGARRSSFIQTVKDSQELEITLPLRPSEAGQAALISAFNNRTTLILAVILDDGEAVPNEDQLTFSCKITEYTNMLSAKTTRATASFTASIIGDVAYGARTT